MAMPSSRPARPPRAPQRAKLTGTSDTLGRSRTSRQGAPGAGWPSPPPSTKELERVLEYDRVRAATKLNDEEVAVLLSSRSAASHSGKPARPPREPQLGKLGSSGTLRRSRTSR